MAGHGHPIFRERPNVAFNQWPLSPRGKRVAPVQGVDARCRRVDLRCEHAVTACRRQRHVEAADAGEQIDEVE